KWAGQPVRRPSGSEIELVAYRAAFGQVLCKIVAQVLNAPEGYAARHKNELYPIPLQIASADAGKQLGLDVHAALAFMIVCESNRIKNSTSFWSRLFSGEKVARHRDHTRMLDAGGALMENHWDSAQFGEFVRLAGENFL